MGVVPLLILFNEASINPFLDPALDFLNLFLRSRIGTTFTLASSQTEVSVSGPSGPVFCRTGEVARRRTPPLRSGAVSSVGVKVHTLHFLLEIYLSMEVALTTLILFLPIHSFGRY